MIDNLSEIQRSLIDKLSIENLLDGIIYLVRHYNKDKFEIVFVVSQNSICYPITGKLFYFLQSSLSESSISDTLTKVSRIFKYKDLLTIIRTNKLNKIFLPQLAPKSI